MGLLLNVDILSKYGLCIDLMDLRPMLKSGQLLGEIDWGENVSVFKCDCSETQGITAVG